MANSVFNTSLQQTDTVSKIVVGLERISEAIRVLLWEHAKHHGLSPIQIQLLIFIRYHSEALCNVSHLAREFNMTKPTVSDAIKALEKKELITKKPGLSDARSYSIALSESGRRLVQSLEGFTAPLEKALLDFKSDEQNDLLKSITKLIYKLHKSGIISVQRTCYGCRFYEKKGRDHYCHLLKKDLTDGEIRLDCPEYEEKGDKT